MTAVTPEPLPRPETWTGTFLLVIVPSPSWPLTLFPQLRTVPSDLRARVWVPPAATAVTPEPLPRPETSTGADLLVVVPSPIWPLPLNPQARTVPSDLRAREWV